MTSIFNKPPPLSKKQAMFKKGTSAQFKVSSGYSKLKCGKSSDTVKRKLKDAGETYFESQKETTKSRRPEGDIPQGGILSIFDDRYVQTWISELNPRT